MSAPLRRCDACSFNAAIIAEPFRKRAGPENRTVSS